MKSSRDLIVVLTGAGISAESGIKTFRDHGGLWENHSVEEVASLEGFWTNPELVQRFYNARRLQLLSPEIKPNAAHLALAELEKNWPGEFLLVTQNVDNLHERAGSKCLIHMHGELLKVRCMESEQVFEWTQAIEPVTLCPCCRKAGTLRPHIVWFGEMPLEMERISEALERCSIFLSIGTSGNVYPAAGFVSQIRPEAESIEINKEPSMVSGEFQEHRIGPASVEVPKFVREILKRTSSGALSTFAVLFMLSMAALSLFSQAARADFDFDPSEQKMPYRATLSSHAVPSRDAGGGNGTYGERDLSLKGSLQVSNDVQMEKGKFSMTKFSVQPQLDRRVLSGLGSLNRDATLYSQGVGFSGFHLSESQEAYFFGAGISHSGEAGPSGASLWVPSVYAAATHPFNRDTALIYGAAFSTSFGFFIPVPVLGLTSKLSSEWTFTTILPVITQFSWRPVDPWNFVGFLKASGYESKIANNQSFDTSDSSVKLKAQAFELGVGAGYEISSNLSVRGDVGALLARKLKYEDSNNTLMVQKLSAAPVMLTLSATARFGSEK
jgi:NAD-dependent deacetylase